MIVQVCSLNVNSRKAALAATLWKEIKASSTTWTEPFYSERTALTDHGNQFELSANNKRIREKIVKKRQYNKPWLILRSLKIEWRISSYRRWQSVRRNAAWDWSRWERRERSKQREAVRQVSHGWTLDFSLYPKTTVRQV